MKDFLFKKRYSQTLLLLFLQLNQSDYKIVSDWDSFLENRQKNHFTISAMAFQDAWNLDLERLKRCYIMIVSPDSRLIPFCAYNLSNRDGETLYRK